MEHNFEYQKMDYVKIREWVTDQSLRIQNPLSPYFHDLRHTTDHIDWEHISSNPNAVQTIEYGLALQDCPVYWLEVINNPSAVNITTEILRTFIFLAEYVSQYSYELWQLKYNDLALVLLCDLLPEPERGNLVKYFPPIREILDHIDYDNEEDPVELLETILSGHSSAISILEANPSWIDWQSLSRNNGAIHLLEANVDKIDWSMLSYNNKARQLLCNNEDKIDWINGSSNPCIGHLLKYHIDQLNWDRLSHNPSEDALILMKQYPNKLNWDGIAMNPTAYVLLREYPEKTNWNLLSLNPNAIDMLESNIDKVNWSNVARNPGAIEFMERHIDMIDQYKVRLNPNIVTYDYEAIKIDREELNAELIACMYHPDRIAEWLKIGNDLDDYLN